METPVRIILVGYMGSGKTTVGKALAKVLGLPFYDLDWYIESRMRKTVKQLFDERGEDGFRKVERNMLHEVAEFENIVLSCGGRRHAVLLRQYGLYQPAGRVGLSQVYHRCACAAFEDGQDRTPVVAQQDTRGGRHVHRATAPSA